MKYFNWKLIFVLISGSVANVVFADVVKTYQETYQKAALAHNAGEFKKSEHWHRLNYELINSQASVPVHIRSEVRINLAAATLKLAKFKETEVLLSEAQRIMNTDTSANPRAMAALIGNFGSLYSAKGEYKKAELALLEARSMFEVAGGDNGVHLANLDIDLARTAVALGNITAALEHYKRGLQYFPRSRYSAMPFLEEVRREYNKLQKQQKK